MSHLAAAHSYSGPGALRRRLLLIAAVLAGAAMVLAVLVARGAPWPQSWDDALRERLLRVADGSALLEGLGRLLDVVGGGIVATAVAVGAVVVLVVLRRRTEALFIAVSALGGVLLNTLVKALVERPRATEPPALLVETSSSFPSGHAMAAVYVYGALALLVWVLGRDQWWTRLLAVVLGAIAVLVPLSRLWMGVHFLSDVVAGVLLASAWVCVAAALTLVGRDEPPVVEWWQR